MNIEEWPAWLLQAALQYFAVRSVHPNSAAAQCLHVPTLPPPVAILLVEVSATVLLPASHTVSCCHAAC